MIPLAQATKLAERIAAELAPFCERLEIAGSIRRRRPFCGDIDLVILPSHNVALRERIFQNPGTAKVIDGPINLIARLANGVQLDIFLACPPRQELFSSQPTNFGSLLLCRTGSKEHNIFLIEHAKKKALIWDPYHGVFDHSGNLLASATEEEVFDALNLDFRPPETRER